MEAVTKFLLSFSQSSSEFQGLFKHCAHYTSSIPVFSIRVEIGLGAYLPSDTVMIKIHSCKFAKHFLETFTKILMYTDIAKIYKTAARRQPECDVRHCNAVITLR
eukprot:1548464-Pleurochrysis_carterae.AAC.1